MTMQDSKIRLTFGDTYGDTGKGMQNFRMLYEMLAGMKILGDAGYRNRILENPFGVLANEDSLLNVTPFGTGNAGNNIYLLNGQKVPTHLLPPGALFTPYTISLLGSQKKANLQDLSDEINLANSHGCEIVPGKNLFIDGYAGLTLPQDVELDRAMNKELRGTFKGSGPSSARRTSRFDPRAADLLRLNAPDVQERIWKGVEEYNALLRHHGGREYTFKETMEWLKQWGEHYGPGFVADGEKLVRLARNNPSARIFINGTQGLCLDVDFGSIGRTVSYGTSIQDAFKGAYLPVNVGDYDVSIVEKAYVTRAGSGLFPGEFQDEQAEVLADMGQEIGVTSGNRRRVGPDNIAETRYQIRLGAPGLTSVIITKVDVYGQFMERFGPQRAIIGYKKPGGEIVDHLSFPEEVEIVWGPEYHWGRIPPEKKRRMIEKGFPEFPESMREALVIKAKELRAPISAIGLGPYFNDTATRGLYEETSGVLK